MPDELVRELCGVEKGKDSRVDKTVLLLFGYTENIERVGLLKGYKKGVCGKLLGKLTAKTME